jgi:uncharacterized iron-regulated protein
MCIVAAVLATACASPQQVPDQAEPPAEPPKPQLEAGIYATDSGERLEADELYERLGEHQFVVVGERHGNAFHHDVQAKVFRQLAARSGRVALGMEAFQRPFQEPLVAYVLAEIDEEEMLEQTEYAERWGVDAELLRPLWKHAREHQYPLVALNAPRELSKKIAEVGLEGLDPDERAQIPELDLDYPEHRRYVRRAFEEHDMDMGDEAFERFYTAQVVWDETMAETAVEFVEDHRGVRPMVLTAGLAHANRAFGIPPRIERRTDAGVAVVRPVDLDDEDLPADGVSAFADEADFVWVGR